jgi:hypothetical protein
MKKEQRRRGCSPARCQSCGSKSRGSCWQKETISNALITNGQVRSERGCDSALTLRLEVLTVR